MTKRELGPQARMLAATMNPTVLGSVPLEVATMRAVIIKEAIGQPVPATQIPPSIRRGSNFK